MSSQSDKSQSVKVTWPHDDDLAFECEAASDALQGSHASVLVTKLWESRDKGDFEFQTRDQTLRAHSSVVAACSPVLEAMLSSQMIEAINSSVRVDAESSTVSAFLRFAYVGDLSCEPSQIPELLKLAHQYEIPALIEMCCAAMVKHVDAETAVPFIRVLRILEGDPLKLPRSNPAWTAVGKGPSSGVFDSVFISGATTVPSGTERPFVPSGAQNPVFGPLVSGEPFVNANGGTTIYPAAFFGTQKGGKGKDSWPCPGHRTEEVDEPQKSNEKAKADAANSKYAGVSPIARAFVRMSKMIASQPDLLMATLREL
eukprot:TRINITY_DN78684_c0_g1_i1.p1 TRINITY_DN78684_c0_g1~~TRINITY_DN78684_c0_g1_i1.p1  ORF type:complete len:323 (+),score=52.24 TRINITY_DN78684_c0_g1_i1:29-970(+)